MVQQITRPWLFLIIGYPSCTSWEFLKSKQYLQHYAQTVTSAKDLGTLKEQTNCAIQSNLWFTLTKKSTAWWKMQQMPVPDKKRKEQLTSKTNCRVFRTEKTPLVKRALDAERAARRPYDLWRKRKNDVPTLTSRKQNLKRWTKLKDLPLNSTNKLQHQQVSRAEGTSNRKCRRWRRRRSLLRK